MHVLPPIPPVHTLPRVWRPAGSQASYLRCWHSLWPIFIQFFTNSMLGYPQPGICAASCFAHKRLVKDLAPSFTKYPVCFVSRGKSQMHKNVYFEKIRNTSDPHRYWHCLFCSTPKTVWNFVLGSSLFVGKTWAWCTWCNGGHTSGCPLPNLAPILPPASAQCIRFLIWSQVVTPKLYLANVQTPSIFYFPHYIFLPPTISEHCL